MPEFWLAFLSSFWPGLVGKEEGDLHTASHRGAWARSAQSILPFSSVLLLFFLLLVFQPLAGLKAYKGKIWNRSVHP